MTFPTTFLSLPSRDPHKTWSANIHAAHRVICNLYRHASAVLHLEDADPAQVSFHINAVTSDALPILQAMEDEPPSLFSDASSESSRLPCEWLSAAAQQLGNLVVALRDRGELGRDW
jgi:hypothetical protein